LAALRITDYYTSFLQMLAYMFSPLIGVVMSDFFLIQRTRLDLPEMYRNDGRFHYTGGINPIAWSVVGMGIVIGFFTPSYLVASLVSIACSGVMYYVLMRMFYLHREM
jgi:NCS1 family nucleobase:cation symporter-1